jgi:hypothetical protein
MKTIEVKVIRSEEGLMTIRATLKRELTNNFKVKEISTGKTFEMFGGFNGNPWDLWLRKSGTKGCTSKTFIRAGIGSFKDIVWELKHMNITASEILLALEATETALLKSKEDADKSAIQSFANVERAAKWVANDEGNSQKRRTRWMNRAVRIGVNRSFGNLLRDKCFELIKVKV